MTIWNPIFEVERIKQTVRRAQLLTHGDLNPVAKRAGAEDSRQATIRNRVLQ